MDVAQQLVVINDGRVEQSGTPDELYEQPSSAFVMGFVGPVSKLGDEWVRPHDIDVLVEPDDGAVQALVDRVARVGFEVRVEATLADGEMVSVLLTRHDTAELELEAGQIVWLRPHGLRQFAR